MRRTVLTAMVAAISVAAVSVVSAETHEPLARFFESAGQATTAQPERRRPRPPPPPAAPAPAVAATRRPTSAPRPEFVVGVFGDAFAVSIARGLNDAEPAEQGREVEDESADDAGVATVDPAAWTNAIEVAQRNAGRLDAAVLMVGRGDGTALTDASGARQEPGSPAWQRLYGDRVAAVADRFRDKHVPLIWVGLPIVRDAETAKLYAMLNEIVHDRAVREGAVYVDSWQAFADENGDFSTVGPDVDGRPATLRWSNGWNFTRAGARKLASFALPDLKRIRDRLRSSEELAAVPAANPDSFDQALNIDVNAQILREAGLPTSPAGVAPGGTATAQATAGPVVVLTAAPLSADGRLASAEAGAAMPPGLTEASNGSHPGRTDDFAWPNP